MLVNHLTAGAHRIRLPKTRFSGEKTLVGHIRTSLFPFSLSNVAFGVGIAKFAWDLGTVVYGYTIVCK